MAKIQGNEFTIISQIYSWTLLQFSFALLEKSEVLLPVLPVHGRGKLFKSSKCCGKKISWLGFAGVMKLCIWRGGSNFDAHVSVILRGFHCFGTCFQWVSIFHQSFHMVIHLPKSSWGVKYITFQKTDPSEVIISRTWRVANSVGQIWFLSFLENGKDSKRFDSMNMWRIYLFSIVFCSA